MYKSSTTPDDPIEGVLDALSAGSRRRRPAARRLPGARRDLHPRHHARDQRDPDRPHRAHRLPHDRGPPGHPGDPRGRPDRALQLHGPLPRALRAARADLRDQGADRRRWRGRQTARRGGRARGDRAASEKAGRGGRRLPLVVDRQPGPRAAGRRAPGGASARGRLHAFAPAQPDPSRIPAGVLDLHRCFAEAAHARLSAWAEGPAAAGGVRRAGADGDLAGRDHGRRRRRRSADP